MNKFNFYLIALLFIGYSVTVHAQDEPKWISGNSFNVFVPQAKLADRYSHGFGVYGNIDYNFNKNFAFRFDLGWNDVSGPETTYIDTLGIIHSDHPNMSVWEFTAGFKAQVSVLYIEARGGYYSGVNSWGFTPAVGLRIKKFDLQANYTLAGDSEWMAFRIGYYWGQ